MMQISWFRMLSTGTRMPVCSAPDIARLCAVTWTVPMFIRFTSTSVTIVLLCAGLQPNEEGTREPSTWRETSLVHVAELNPLPIRFC